MLGVLNNENESLTLALTGAAAVTEPTFDLVTNLGGKVGRTTGGTVVVLATGGPYGASVNLQRLLVHNADTAAVTAILKKKISSTSYQILKTTIPSLGNLIVTETGYEVSDSAGNKLQSVALSTSGSGAPAGTGNVASEAGAVVHQTVLTFTDMLVAVTDALAYASQKIYDFPEGRIHIMGVTANLQFGVTTTRASTINDNAALKFAVGSVAASNATLTGTMVDLLPKTSKTLDGAVAAYTTAVGAALGAAAQFDGTTSALDAFLNLAFETGTDIDADGTLKISGSITMTWVNLGDY